MEELDLLFSTEIETKRKNVEQLTNSDTLNSETPKFVKRRQLEELHKQNYMREQEQLEKQREAYRTRMLHEKELLRQKAAPSKHKQHVSLSEHPSSLSEEASTTPSLSSEEVVKRLRAKGQPIRLFGETDERRIRRLRTVESTETDMEGQRNDFMKTVAQLEASLDLEALKRKVEETDKTCVETNILTPSILNVPITVKMLLGDRSFVCRLIQHYLKRLITEWEEELQNRPIAIKRSTQGKLAAATQRQTNDYIQPLFHMLTDRSIPDDVLQHVTTICEYMQQREYVKASDCYYLLSIGNAPWPIGVTMVGIHERSAREKIFSSQVAHVLNDERQRKWIQSLKRLMTFSQKRYPPEDPSKCV
jgi:pre-mRNA-splicing factor 18